MAKPLSKTVVVAYGRSAVAKSGKKGAILLDGPFLQAPQGAKIRSGERGRKHRRRNLASPVPAQQGDSTAPR